MRKLFVFLILSGVFLSPALADRSIDKTVAADADGEVSIELIAGSVRIIGWDRNEVRVSGTVGDDVKEVEISAEDGEVAIEVELPDSDDDSSGRRSFNDAGADLEIHVPRGSTVEAESISAGFTLENLTGVVDVESISGEIELKGSVSEVELASISGQISVESDEPLEEGSFETISGSIELRAALAPGGDFSFETVSGNVELRLPADTSADFNVETFSGRIENEFGPQAERTSEYAPGKELEFTIGGGDADVEIESFSGKIEILID